MTAEVFTANKIHIVDSWLRHCIVWYAVSSDSEDHTACTYIQPALTMEALCSF